MAWIRWRGQSAQLMATVWHDGKNRHRYLASLGGVYTVPEWKQAQIQQRFPGIPIGSTPKIETISPCAFPLDTITPTWETLPPTWQAMDRGGYSVLGDGQDRPAAGPASRLPLRAASPAWTPAPVAPIGFFAPKARVRGGVRPR